MTMYNYDQLYKDKWLELTQRGMSPKEADIHAQEYADRLKKYFKEESEQHCMIESTVRSLDKIYNT